MACHRSSLQLVIAASLHLQGRVKLADFGFARPQGPGVGRALSPYVATRWYRAPELLVGDAYGPGVDIWALGCLLVELQTGEPVSTSIPIIDVVIGWQHCAAPRDGPHGYRVALYTQASLCFLGKPTPTSCGSSCGAWGPRSDNLAA
jgi:serine/threonine protein kinase